MKKIYAILNEYCYIDNNLQIKADSSIEDKNMTFIILLF